MLDGCLITAARLLSLPRKEASLRQKPNRADMASLNGSSGAQSASASGQASPRRVDNFIPLVTVIVSTFLGLLVPFGVGEAVWLSEIVQSHIATASIASQRNDH